MSRKKINFSAKTKLDDIVKLKEEKSKNNIIKKPVPARPVSFRLREIDLQRLEYTLNKANALNESHDFNRTSLIRGLIMLGSEAEADQILEMIRKSL